MKFIFLSVLILQFFAPSKSEARVAEVRQYLKVEINPGTQQLVEVEFFLLNPSIDECIGLHDRLPEVRRIQCNYDDRSTRITEFFQRKAGFHKIVIYVEDGITFRIK